MPGPDLLELFVGRLEEIGASYLVTGSVAATLWPEYVIVRKLEFRREGGSPKHLRDIRSMLSVSPELVAMAVLEGWIERRGLGDPGAEVRGA